MNDYWELVVLCTMFVLTFVSFVLVFISCVGLSIAIEDDKVGDMVMFSISAVVFTLLVIMSGVYVYVYQ